MVIAQKLLNNSTTQTHYRDCDWIGIKWVGKMAYRDCDMDWNKVGG